MKEMKVNVNLIFTPAEGKYPNVDKVFESLKKLMNDGYIIKRFEWKVDELPEADIELGTIEVGI